MIGLHHIWAFLHSPSPGGEQFCCTVNPFRLNSSDTCRCEWGTGPVMVQLSQLPGGQGEEGSALQSGYSFDQAWVGVLWGLWMEWLRNAVVCPPSYSLLALGRV